MPQPEPVASITERYGLTLPERVDAWIDGRAREVAADPTLDRDCPATEEHLYSVGHCDAAVVDEAVAAARRVADSSNWPTLAHNDRKRILRRVMDVIDKHREELAVVQALETGLSLASMQNLHVPRTIDNFDFFIEAAGTTGGHTYRQTGQFLSVVTREAAGVAAILSPWNAPLALTSMKLGAALAFGNSCVIKASERSPYSVYRFVEILHEADLPAGLINLVNGPGPVTGAALVAHPGVDVVGFVGGTRTGAAIIENTAAGIKKVGLELGGKSANIVMPSADFDKAIDGSLLAILSGSGQQCLAGSRLFVHETIADRFIATYVERMNNVRVGDPFAASTEVGPLAFNGHYEKVLSYADIARQEGAEILCGGERAAGFDKGYFVAPTAVLAADNQNRVCQEEIFGPFVSIQRVADANEAVRLANDSQYGLVSYVWSNDLAEVTRVSNAIKAGTVWVNTPLARDLRAPFGGYKQSGLGRDGLHASVDLMTEEKTVMYPQGELSLPRLGLDSNSS